MNRYEEVETGIDQLFYEGGLLCVPHSGYVFTWIDKF